MHYPDAMPLSKSNLLGFVPELQGSTVPVPFYVDSLHGTMPLAACTMTGDEAK